MKEIKYVIYSFLFGFFVFILWENAAYIFRDVNDNWIDSIICGIIGLMMGSYVMYTTENDLSREFYNLLFFSSIVLNVLLIPVYISIYSSFNVPLVKSTCFMLPLFNYLIAYVILRNLKNIIEK